MSKIDYWLECLSQAAEEAGIVLDPQILKVLAKAAEDGHDHYSMAFYTPSSSEIYQPKIDELKQELAKEQAKRFCGNCNGSGVIYENFGVRSSISQCHKCGGNGKI